MEPAMGKTGEKYHAYKLYDGQKYYSLLKFRYKELGVLIDIYFKDWVIFVITIMEIIATFLFLKSIGDLEHIAVWVCQI